MSASPITGLLTYPDEPEKILRHRTGLKRELRQRAIRRKVRIAILGGSTTHEVKSTLELFLLAAGIEPSFYESDYNRFREDVLYEEPKLMAFAPEIVYFHTTSHNLSKWPKPFASDVEIDAVFQEEYERFSTVWQKAHTLFAATIIQNNFEPPAGRIFGHRDNIEAFGRGHFIQRMNSAFARSAQTSKWLLIHDINFLAASIGLRRWFSEEYWYRYKLAVTPAATVSLARSLANLVRNLLVGPRKCLVLDLDNTLWGGVIGDDGLNGIRLGKDNPVGEAYIEFQHYIKSLRARGVILAVCSKNELAAARSGFSHPDSVLTIDDFAAFYANWEPKPLNVQAIARDLNIGLDSLVFVDDNPVEREIVASQLPMVAVPNVGDQVTRFAEILEAEGYFEPIFLSADDSQRSHYYQLNAQRQTEQANFASYDDFLASLQMTAEIRPFQSLYIERITQLINKTNQFNLTTRRYTLTEITAIAVDSRYLTFYGRLADRMGDNGLVSVIIGSVEGERLTIDLWLMSCRVLKRGMELAMLQVLIEGCRRRGVREIVGWYFPTEKNAMVADHYAACGFERVTAGANGEGTQWRLVLPEKLPSLAHHITLQNHE